MWKNHLTVALRSLSRRKGFSALNVVGLAVGLAAVLLIGLFVRDELAFDRFHPRAERTYRLVMAGDASTVGWPFGRILEDEMPEVEAVTYLRTYPTLPLEHDGAALSETVFYADDRFLDVFSFPVVAGDAATALREPFTLVVSTHLARKLFGTTQAVGRTLTFADTVDVTVTGVVEVPRPSHIQFDALLSFATLRPLFGPDEFDAQFTGGWGNWNVVNYVLLRPDASPEAVASKIRDLPMARAGDVFTSWGVAPTLGLEPMTSVYLESSLGNPLGPSGRMGTVYFLAAIGLFVLLLAIVNFVNLATARAVERGREVGVRKAVGAARALLVRQFLVESVLTTGIAALLGAGLAVLARPWFNELTARDYTLSLLFAPSMLAGLAGLIVVVGVLAGAYPAFALSGFRPSAVLRGAFATSRQGRRLRQGLVVFQFAVTCVLVVGTLVVARQIRYMQTQPLGFAAEQVLTLPVTGVEARGVRAQADAFRQALLASPAVTHVTNAYGLPGQGGWQGQVSYPEGMPDGQGFSLEYVPVGAEYVRTLGLEIVAGRDFTGGEADLQQGVIINENAARLAGWTPQEAIGKSFTSPGSGKPEGVVVGVVRDFYQRGLQQPIGPVMLGLGGPSSNVFALRTTDPTAAVAHARRTWAQFAPEGAFSYAFLDDLFNEQYRSEVRTARIFSTFAGLAILVACLGLLGLAAFAVRQRTKEIGVRRVLGASTASVVALLSRDFAVLVVAGLALAVPIAYVAMTRWLEGFAHAVTLGPGVFVLAGVLALTVALLTVSYHVVRAATANPTRALRSE